MAIPVFEERISPLFDVAERFVLYEISNNRISQRIVIRLSEGNEKARVLKLGELGVKVLICGAVSRHLSSIIVEKGIRLIPWVNGQVDDIIELFIKDALTPQFPDRGSCGGMMRRGRLKREQSVDVMYKNDEKIKKELS